MPENVQQEIEDLNLSNAKATLLTHTLLRENPDVQKWLAEQIADKSLKEAQAIVKETLYNLEQGIKQVSTPTDEKEEVEYTEEYEQEEDIKNKEVTDKTFQFDLGKINIDVCHLIGEILRRPLSKGEIMYDKPDVYERKLDELKGNLRDIKTDRLKMFAVNVAVLDKICHAILDAARARK